MGAEVSAISEQAYRTLTGVRLSKPTIVLYGPARQPLEVLGQFTGKLISWQHTHSAIIYIIRDLQNNLLSLSAIKELKLIRRLDATHIEDEWTQEFPHLVWAPWEKNTGSS